MVPHLWIIDCLEKIGINEKIRRLLAESMKSWRLELISGANTTKRTKNFSR